MKKRIRVSFISINIFIFLVLTLLISVRQVNTETVPNSDNAEEQIENIEGLQNTEVDTLTIQPDSLMSNEEVISVEDTLYIAQTDSIITDSILTEYLSHWDYKLISDTTYTEFAPNLFNKKLSHYYINYADSNEILSYLFYKSFPSQDISYPFLKNKLYSYSEEIDIKKNNSLITSSFSNADIVEPFSLPLEKYWGMQFKNNFYDNFYEDLSKFQLNKQQTESTEGIIPDIEFPKIKMPKAMKRFFGDNLGRLRVTGSQKITVGGSRTVKKPDPVYEGSKKSILPDLTMKQDLNLGISGTIGDKIKVNVEQTSEESIFKKNKISIKYEGDEDDPIKLIEGGDTRLSLSGSQFISYSASSEDLFGLKGEFEFGKLKLTTIVSQQEGQHASASATGSSMEDFTDYQDKDFARNKYFFIDNPNSIFNCNIDTLQISEWSYIDNSMPKDGTVRIFVDDRKLDPTDIPGYSIDDINHEESYRFQELEVTTEIQDFFIDYLNAPFMIEFFKYIGNDYVIGLIYEEKSGYTYGYDYGDSLEVKLIKKDYTQVSNAYLDDALWNYQIKNIYSLNSKNIDNQGFELNIFRYLHNGEKEEGYTDTTTSTYTPFIEILKLDRNGDGRVDQSDNTVDFVKGIITFPMLEPFRPFWFKGYDPTLGINIIYDELSPDPEDYDPFYISVKMKTTASQINLGHINIINNSEKVYVDNDLKKRGVDYTIDYMSGTVTLKGDAALDPNANVNVKFEYEPLFALDKKNMFGLRADYEFNKNASIGTTIMYEAGSVKDERPKVGNEPKKILVGDIDGEISMDLPFITDVVDMIPLIDTQEKSTFTLSGEIAMSIPNPNATEKQEAYIDDMEGVVEAYSFGISRTDWVNASFPISIEPEDSTRGDMQWYNPYHTFRARDIYQDLPDREGKEYVTVLEGKITPTENQQQYWGGIMKAFGSSPVDFSKKKYIEIMMKSDENPGDSLFIDLGFISEDYYPILHPNGILDEEDGCVNGIKDGELDVGEDIGLDRTGGKDPSPPKNHSQDGTPGIDDGNDDYYYSVNSNEYSQINGTEENNKLDSEDLNKNDNLDQIDRYLQYSINLAEINSDILISEYNDWKFIRIPLQDSTYYEIKGVGDVDFKTIKYTRLWAKSDSSSSITIDFASIDVVGNKWKASPIYDASLHIVDSTSLGPDEKFEIATENNKKNPKYTPPPGSIDKEEEKKSKEKEIEQSLFLDCFNIQPDRYIYARQNFVDAINLLLYDKVKFWVYGQTEDSTETGEATIIFRLGADTLNYYEYREEIELYQDIDEVMAEGRWKSISIDFVDFSGLKKAGIPDTSAHFSIVGNPSLGYIKQVAVGLLRQDSLITNFSGNIFFDDIRVANPCDEVGIASKITLKTKFADFADINLSFSNKTPNFYTLGESGGEEANSYKYTLNNKFSLNKFLPASWGFNIPLKVDYSYSETKPRFKPNSDVELTSKAEKDSLKTTRNTKSASISFKKSKKSTNPIIKYLMDNLFLSARISEDHYLSPTRMDTTLKYSGTVTYDLNFSKDNSLGIFKEFKIFYLPQKMSFDIDYSYNRSDTWKKQSGEGFSFIKDFKIPTETAKPKLSINYEIFSNFTTNYKLQATRNLQKKNYIKNINIGVESNRSQNIDLKYSPVFLKFINFSSGYSTKYQQDRKESTPTTGSDSISIQYEVSNNRTTTAGLTLKFDKWGKSLMDVSKNLLSYKEKKDEKEIKEEEIKIEDSEGKIEIKEEEIIIEDSKDEIELIEEEIIEDSENEMIDEIKIEEEMDSLEIKEEEIKKDKLRISPFRRIASLSGQAMGFGIKVLGSTKFNYSNKNNTKYKVDPDSLPDYEYQIGVSDLGYGDLQSINRTDEYSISTSNRFDVLTNLVADVRVDYKQTFANKSGGKANTTSYTLPDVNLTYSGLDNIIPWDFVSGSTVSTGVNRIVTKTGPTPPSDTDKITLKSSISLPINVLKTLNPKLSGSYQYTYDNNSNTKIEHKGNALNLSASFKYSFQSEKGIKIPLLKRIKMKNKLVTNLKISYNANFNQQYLPQDKKWDIQADNNKLLIEPGVTYSFSRDINGGLTGKYDYSKDNKSGKSKYITTLNIWVEFKF